MKNVLVMESGSFKTIGGAAKDTYSIYEYLKSFHNYRVDAFGDFSKFGNDVSYVTEKELPKREYDVLLLNSIRDVLPAGRYIRAHGSAATIYTDRADVMGHYARSPSKRLVAYGGHLFSDPSRSERMLTGSGTSAGARKTVRDFFSKSYELHMFREMRKWLTYYVAINADEVAYAKRFFTRTTKIEYVPRAPHEIFKRLGSKKKFSGALYVGRLEETQKNVSFLINGIKRVVELHRELSKTELLRIAGTGPDEQHYKELARRLGLEKNITFLGFVENGPGLVELYNNAGFLVSTSNWESIGRSVLEAMACGLPVLLNEKINVVINYNPKTTLVSDGRTGLVYNHSSIEDFADKFYSLYSDAEQARHIGANAAIFIGNELSMGKVLEAYKRMIDST